jgi:hypothetical protein
MSGGCGVPAALDTCTAKGICRAPGGGENSNVVFPIFGLVFESAKLAQNCGCPGDFR